MQPRALRSQLVHSRFTPGTSHPAIANEKLDPACEDICWGYYDDCVEGRCNYNPCQYCDDELLSCLVGLCGACEPSTVVTTQVEWLPPTYNPPQCISRDNPPLGWNNPAIYRIRNTTKKITTTTTTTYLSCSQNVSSEVSYESDWCIEQYQDQSCMPSTWYAEGYFC